MTTDASNDTDQPPQSFLSKLRQRSAIIFTIGLAISVASFVENLHIGKDAIAYAVSELSKVQGWEDFVRAAAAIFHGMLEWWRGVLRDLLSFLPFHIPQWLHDPVSIGFFGVSRAVSRALRSFAEKGSMNLWGTLVNIYAAAESALWFIIIPMVAAMFIDDAIYGNYSLLGPEGLAFLLIIGVFALVIFVVRKRAGVALMKRYNELRETQDERIKEDLDAIFGQDGG